MKNFPLFFIISFSVFFSVVSCRSEQTAFPQVSEGIHAQPSWMNDIVKPVVRSSAARIEGIASSEKGDMSPLAGQLASNQARALVVTALHQILEKVRAQITKHDKALGVELNYDPAFLKLEVVGIEKIENKDSWLRADGTYWALAVLALDSYTSEVKKLQQEGKLAGYLEPKNTERVLVLLEKICAEGETKEISDATQS